MSFSPLPNAGIEPRLKAIYDDNRNEYKPIEEHVTKWLPKWVEDHAPPDTEEEWIKLMRPSVGRPDYRRLALYLAQNVTPKNCERHVLHDMRQLLQRAIEKRQENRNIWEITGGILDNGHDEWYLTLTVMRDELGLALDAYDHQVDSELEAQKAPTQTAPPTPSRTEGIWAVVNSTERKRKQTDTEVALEDQKKSKRKAQVTGSEQESLENPASGRADVDDAEPEQDKSELLETDGAEQKEMEREHADRQEANERDANDEQDREEPLHQDEVEQDEVDDDEANANRGDEEEVDDGHADDDPNKDDQNKDEQMDPKETCQEQAKQQPDKPPTRRQIRREEKQIRHEEGKSKRFVPNEEAERQEEAQRKKGQKQRQKERKREEREKEAAKEEAKKRKEEAEIRRKVREAIRWFFTSIAGATVAGIFVLNKYYFFPQ